MKFIIYFIILFSFFHFLIGLGTAGSILASLFIVALSPFIVMMFSAAIFAIWAGILFLVGLIGYGISKIVDLFNQKRP
ncbi:integral membrane protein [Erwinia phage Cronus]|uniref:Integral membrane protein n=1 Tax=Erwinia phage Cronus TaxID=2163633 RepID=A0A2S1GM22_9CAUD|nr:integral membrane protein [Erwinia phage Cronus]AWD90430.1 integral membrane protein [Erwinia phage Cronus]